MKKDDIVEITWEDAASKSGWHDIFEVIQDLDKHPFVAHSYGRVIHVSQKRVIISGDIVFKEPFNNDVSRTMCIPKSVIIEVRQLKPIGHNKHSRKQA